MPLKVKCEHCNQEMILDEGFAGGVCRCSQCGQMQNVAQDAPRISTVPADSGRSFSAGRFVKRYAVGLIILVLLAFTGGVVIVILGQLSPGTNNVEVEMESGPVEGPSFLTRMPIEGNSVVYCLDHGGSMNTSFDLVRNGVIRSLESLGEDKLFDIIFWEEEGFRQMQPPGLRYATAENIALARSRLNEIIPRGLPIPGPALKKALSLDPANICLISDQLFDSQQQTSLLKLVSEHDVKILAVGLFSEEMDKTFNKIAQQTGGRYMAVEPDLLREWLMKEPDMEPTGGKDGF